MGDRTRESESSELEADIARTCGVLNATTGHLVGLLARVLETGCWQVAGIHSPTQWVAWQCGVSPSRARSLLAMARRRAELPETSAAHEAGELCEDQVAVIARHAPAGVDAQVAELARSATVTQLRRVLGSYPFAEAPPKPDEPEPPAPPEEPRSVSFGQTESGSWRLSAELAPDEGALVERALMAARDELFHAGEGDSAPHTIPDMPRTPNSVSWTDAFVEDGGTTDTPNLLALCRRHHRLHHLGHLDIRGDADDPDGVVFTDHRGDRLDSCGRPVPPRLPVEAAAAGLGIAVGAWSHPTGERLDPGAVSFHEPAA